MLPACWEFLTFNLFIIFLAFVLLRWGRRVTRGWPRKFLQPFGLGVYLTPLLLDGNLQYFCFLLFSQTRFGFSLSPRDKLLNVLSYLFYFFVIWFSVTSCFLAYWLSRRLAEFVLDNWRTRLTGLLAHSLTNTVRMLLLGGIHSLLRSHHAQLPLLLAAEFLYLVALLCLMRFWKAHKVIYRVSFTACFSLIRICIQAVLIVQQKEGVVGT